MEAIVPILANDSESISVEGLSNLGFVRDLSLEEELRGLISIPFRAYCVNKLSNLQNLAHSKIQEMQEFFNSEDILYLALQVEEGLYQAVFLSAEDLEMTSGDLRDSYIASNYKQCRYSWAHFAKYGDFLPTFVESQL